MQIIKISKLHKNANGYNFAFLDDHFDYHTAEDNFENLEEALGRTEQYIEKNQKKLTFIALAVIIVAVGIFSYQKYYRAPMELNAQTDMFQAQRYFEVDSFNLAINGDGNYDGFLDIIDNFGSTEAGNLSAYYTGISYHAKKRGFKN